MGSPNFDEVNVIAKKFLKLKDLAEHGSESEKKEYEKYKNYCMNKLSYLIDNKTYRYKRFANYPDLRQDAFDALFNAFKSFKPNEGDFTWWANRYIQTQVSRSANKHSVIRIPLKKAKLTPPHKVSSFPVMMDEADNAAEVIETMEDSSILHEAINQLPEKQQKIVLMYFNFADKKASISSISKELKISRPVCVKLLTEAKVSLRNTLESHFQI